MEAQSESAAQVQLPTQVQAIVKEYQDLFEEPSSLPPRRSLDHVIPLLPGAQPFQTEALQIYSCSERRDRETSG